MINAPNWESAKRRSLSLFINQEKQRNSKVLLLACGQLKIIRHP
jgi:hypothetical protein